MNDDSIKAHLAAQRVANGESAAPLAEFLTPGVMPKDLPGDLVALARWMAAHGEKGEQEALI